MPKVALSFEAVNRHIASASLAPFKRGGAKHFTAAGVSISPADVLKKLCAIWKIVGPIVSLIAKLPLLPKKWRDALQVLITLMNNVCDGT